MAGGASSSSWSSSSSSQAAFSMFARLSRWVALCLLLVSVWNFHRTGGILKSTSKKQGSLEEKSEDIDLGAATAAGVNARASQRGRRRYGDMKTAIVFVCNEKYLDAVLSSVASVRKDGGHVLGDVIVVYDEFGGNGTATATATTTTDWNPPRTVSDVQNAIDREWKLMNFTTEHNNLTEGKNIVYKASELLDEMVNRKPTAFKHLKDPPLLARCDGQNQNAMAHRAYYLKSLVYHPRIADRYDRIMYSDACMTFHSPHLPQLFEMPEVQGRLLAALDPWRWRRFKMRSKLSSCATPRQIDRLQRDYLGVDNPIDHIGWFASGFMLYDAQSLIRSHTSLTGDSSSTLIELLSLYHELSSTFHPGDQLIQSVYWMYVRNQWSSFPMEMMHTDKIPYEFYPRLPNDPHIVTAGTRDRAICLQRPTNSLTILPRKKAIQ